ncbi:MAG: DUF1211 domain-containing protein [Candidatus Aenigmarchaeota archaeon]|nr:DUF1211 domain-containing protein [Candidatus Aenigmarchaeota archaeon]
MKRRKYIREEHARSPERHQTLADGVFAIVMTLLVLELGVEGIAETANSAGVVRGLLEMWPKFLIYGLSFLILGIFWVIHHTLFDAIISYNTTLTWLNILFLMFVALIPFSTALFGEFGAMQITALVYGFNMLLIFNSGWAIWAYVTGKRRLVDENLDPALARGGSLMGLVYTVIMLFAIGISFVNPVISFFIYGLIVVAFITFTALGRAEIAMTVPTAPKSGENNQT